MRSSDRQESPPAGAAANDRRETTGSKAPDAPASTPEILWDDSKMVSFYADVVNLQSTREQVYLFFGTNQTSNLGEKTADVRVRVELNSRMTLSPHAAKRLQLALDTIVKQYEGRFGEIKI
jgi:hypothetical protein